MPCTVCVWAVRVIINLPIWPDNPAISVCAKGQGHRRFQEFTSAESEQEPLVINLYAAIIQPKFRGQTPFQHFVIDLKPFSPNSQDHLSLGNG